MKFEPMLLQDVQRIWLQRHQDARGHFAETFRLDLFQQHCGDYHFVQDNVSSSHAGVLRGLHFQQRQPQGKLLQLLRGRIYDVLVDLRPDSVTFGQWEGCWLDAAEPCLLWAPPGFAHGFYVAAGPAELAYKCSAYYQPDDQYVLSYNDPQLGIDWPCNAAPLLSEKDQQGWSFSEVKALTGV